MNFTHPSHKDMILALLKHEVEFLLIGGYAVIFHGYIRTTGDMDVWLKPSNENKERLLNAFKEMEFELDGLQHVSALDFNEVVAFHIGDEPERIDFLSKVKGLDYEKAFADRRFLTIQGKEVPFLNLDDLIVSKLLADRLKDQADVEELQKIAALRNKDK